MDYYKCNTLFFVIELSEAVVRAASTMWVEVEVILHVCTRSDKGVLLAAHTAHCGQYLGP